MCECTSASERGIKVKLILSKSGPSDPVFHFELTRYVPWLIRRIKVEQLYIRNSAPPYNEIAPNGQTLFIHSNELGRSLIGLFNDKTTPLLGVSKFAGASWLTIPEPQDQMYDCKHTINKVDFWLTGDDGIPYALQAGETAVVVINLYR